MLRSRAALEADQATMRQQQQRLVHEVDQQRQDPQRDAERDPDQETGDEIAAYGGIVSSNRKVTLSMAKAIKPVFYEIVIAPDYEADALKLLQTKKVEITAKPKDDSPWYTTLLVSWLPMLVLVGIWIFFMRQMQAGGGKAMSFGKSRARLMTESSVKVTFKDVAGIEEAKEEVRSAMRKIRRLAPADPDDFGINQQDQFVKMFYKLGGTIASVGVFITGLSLFVGGIGILAMMVISVRERTREIGVRRAVGARRPLARSSGPDVGGEYFISTNDVDLVSGRDRLVVGRLCRAAHRVAGGRRRGQRRRQRQRGDGAGPEGRTEH